MKTKTIQDSLNPVFYTVKDLVYEFDELENAPPVIIHVFDEDKGLFDNNPDYMGSAVIHLKEAHVHNQQKTFKKMLNTPPVPKWHDFRVGLN